MYTFSKVFSIVTVSQSSLLLYSCFYALLAFFFVLCVWQDLHIAFFFVLCVWQDLHLARRLSDEQGGDPARR
jgi:hypothetical protein